VIRGYSIRPVLRFVTWLLVERHREEEDATIMRPRRPRTASVSGYRQNLGPHVGRSTIAPILKAQRLAPAPNRPTSWQTFLRAHWGVIAGADFFTTEVWT
jgi:hypothetical protein